MPKFGVKKVVVLTSPSAVQAIFKLFDHNRILVIQNEFISLIDDDQILTTVTVTTDPPHCAVSNTLATVSKKKLLFVTAEGNRLRKRAPNFPNDVDVLCSGKEQFFSASSHSLYRHNLNDRYLTLKTFKEPVNALSATLTRLLVMLSTNIHVIDIATAQDLVEVPSAVMNPLDIFWSLSAGDSFWFLAVVKPQAMDENRTHKILMAEVNDQHISSEDVTPTDVSLQRKLYCTASSNKVLTLADNGNVILIHQVDNFGKLDLLYRGEATDSSFTAGAVLRVTDGPQPPKVAVGTPDGAVAFLEAV